MPHGTCVDLRLRGDDGADGDCCLTFDAAPSLPALGLRPEGRKAHEPANPSSDKLRTAGKLAGQVLDHGASRRAPAVGEANRSAAAASAQDVARRAGVRWIGLEAFATLDAPGRTVYRFDVRTPEEYEAGHLPGFASAPGGQLVQETDHHVPVRGARIVLADDDGVRAPMTAS